MYLFPFLSLAVAASAAAIAPRDALAAVQPAGPAPNRACSFGTCKFLTQISPSALPAASSYCLSLKVHPGPASTTTSTSTSVQTSTVTAPGPTINSTTTTTISTTTSVICTVSTSAPFTTNVLFKTATYVNTASTSAQTGAAAPSSPKLHKRQFCNGPAPPVPTWLQPAASTCIPMYSDFTAACSCILQPAPITVVTTALQPTTTTIMHAPVTSWTTSTTVLTQTTCTSTTTVPSLPATLTCGATFTAPPTATTTGIVSCPISVPSPTVNAYLQIEGDLDDGTLFEGCFAAKPVIYNFTYSPAVRTPYTPAYSNMCFDLTTVYPIRFLEQWAQGSGATVAARAYTNSQAFVDQVGDTPLGGTAIANQAWYSFSIGMASNPSPCYALNVLPYIPQWPISNLVPWGYLESWGSNSIQLQLAAQSAVAEAGSGTFSVQVTDQNGKPYQGATLGGGVSDVNGMVVLPVPPTAGCYQYKATVPTLTVMRSPIFYLTVVPKFAS